MGRAGDHLNSPSGAAQPVKGGGPGPTNCAPVTHSCIVSRQRPGRRWADAPLPCSNLPRNHLAGRLGLKVLLVITWKVCYGAVFSGR
jgi:hypothetical protein